MTQVRCLGSSDLALHTECRSLWSGLSVAPVAATEAADPAGGCGLPVAGSMGVPSVESRSWQLPRKTFAIMTTPSLTSGFCRRHTGPLGPAASPSVPLRVGDGAAAGGMPRLPSAERSDCSASLVLMLDRSTPARCSQRDGRSSAPMTDMWGTEDASESPPPPPPLPLPAPAPLPAPPPAAECRLGFHSPVPSSTLATHCVRRGMSAQERELVRGMPEVVLEASAAVALACASMRFCDSSVTRLAKRLRPAA